jgi:hypothetical protein
VTTYTRPDGSRVAPDDSWQLFRSRARQAVSHGVADAIDGVRREQRPNTVHDRAYWQSYRRGQRDYAAASERNQREAPARTTRTRSR